MNEIPNKATRKKLSKHAGRVFVGAEEFSFGPPSLLHSIPMMLDPIVTFENQWLDLVDRLLETRPEFKAQFNSKKSLEDLLDCGKFRNDLPLMDTQEELNHFKARDPMIRKYFNEGKQMNFDERFELLKKITRKYNVSESCLRFFLRHSSRRIQSDDLNSSSNFRIRSIVVFPLTSNICDKRMMIYRSRYPCPIVKLKSGPKDKFLPNRFKLQYGPDSTLTVQYNYPRMGLKSQIFASTFMSSTHFSSLDTIIGNMNLDSNQEKDFSVKEMAVISEKIQLENLSYFSVPISQIEFSDYTFRKLCQNTSGMHSNKFTFFNDYRSVSDNNKDLFKVREWAIPQASNLKTYGTKNLLRVRLSLLNTPIIPTLFNPTIKEIDDIEMNGYNFSDGCGFISPKYAEEIYFEILKWNGVKKSHTNENQLLSIDLESYEIDEEMTYKDNYIPSAFQIRLMGIKGMLTVNPQLLDCDIAVRPSMMKFVVPEPKGDKDYHYQLHIVGYSSPSTHARINPTLMHILSGCDNNGIVEQKLISEMQNTVEKTARHYLKDRVTKALVNNLISLADFPALNITGSFKDLELGFLVGPFRNNLSNLKLSIPNSRRLYGVVDPFGVLEEDQVFVQVSDLESDRPLMIESEIIITKEPCFHRGDLRRLKTSDHECLRYLRDVVVFSSKGNRPIANQITGSDLDGDAFFVCWDSDIVQGVKQFPPGLFDVEHPELKEKRFSPDVFKDWVGIRHAFADYFGSEWTSDENWDCVMSKLCEILNKAVDAPKKGFTFQPSPEDFKLIEMFNGYPHYHQKKHGSSVYHSTSIVGKVYDSLMESIQTRLKFKPNPLEFCQKKYITALDDRDFIYTSCLYAIHQATKQKKSPIDVFIEFLREKLDIIKEKKETVQYSTEFLSIFWNQIALINLLDRERFVICSLSSTLDKLSFAARNELVRLVCSNVPTITTLGIERTRMQQENISLQELDGMIIYQANGKADHLIKQMIIDSTLKHQNDLGFNLATLQEEYLGAKRYI